MNTQTQTAPLDIFRRFTGLLIGLAVLMIVLGFAAILKPFVAGLGISLFIAWIIVFSGVVHVVYAFAARSAGSFLWRMLIGVAYMVGGLYLLNNPSIALASFTLVLAVILIAEGLFQVIMFFQLRVLPGSGWILCDGILTLILGGLIAYPWPGSSLWAIGTLVGVNLIISGFTRLMYSVAARSLISSTA
ncbi:MAG: HdeD family acid-resistance protein [Pyrinomonadaceae bacterium]